MRITKAGSIVNIYFYAEVEICETPPHEDVMEFNIIPDKEALSRCAWCQSHISDDMEVFGAGAKLKPNINLPRSSDLPFERNFII